MAWTLPRCLPPPASGLPSSLQRQPIQQLKQAVLTFFSSPLFSRLGSSSFFFPRNNLGTALFQLGEYSLAKVEHQAVLDLFESEDDGLPSVDDGDAGYDVYVDTLVNMYR